MSAEVPIRRLGPDDRTLPVAWLHGYLASPALWNFGATSASGIALPLPGHAPWTLGAEEIGAMLDLDRLAAAYAATLATRFGDRPAVLVGHSTGGLIALHVALRHRERVDSVLLVGALGSGRLDGRSSLLSALVGVPGLGGPVFRAIYDRWISSPRCFGWGLRSVAGPNAALLSAPETLYQDMRRADPEALRRFGLWLKRLDITGGLDGVAVPVRWLIPRADPVVPPRHQIRVMRLLPQADAEIIDTGHLPMVEAPGRFAAAVDRWVVGRELRGLYAPDPGRRPRPFGPARAAPC